VIITQRIVSFVIRAIHISPIFNRQSIAEKGLIPMPVELPHHLKSFKEDDVCTEDGKALYSWMDCNQNEKFIRDMIFCHIYIEPRNALFDEYEKEYPDETIDFRRFVNTNMAPWDYMTYDVYKIEATQWPKKTYFHVQSNDDNIYATTYDMPDEYSHEDKVLCIFNNLQKKISIIGQAEYYYDNGHNIRIIR